MLRKPKMQDIPKLIELIDQLGYQISPAELEQNLFHYQNSVFVLELDHRVIGLLAYLIFPQFHSNEKHMRIISLVIDQKSRGKGLGKRLLQEAEKHAKEMGCSVIELTSASHRMKSGAHTFYANQGYLADGEKIYFRKKLSG